MNHPSIGIKVRVAFCQDIRPNEDLQSLLRWGRNSHWQLLLSKAPGWVVRSRCYEVRNAVHRSIVPLECCRRFGFHVLRRFYIFGVRLWLERVWISQGFKRFLHIFFQRCVVESNRVVNCLLPTGLRAQVNDKGIQTEVSKCDIYIYIYTRLHTVGVALGIFAKWYLTYRLLTFVHDINVTRRRYARSNQKIRYASTLFWVRTLGSQSYGSAPPPLITLAWRVVGRGARDERNRPCAVEHFLLSDSDWRLFWFSAIFLFAPLVFTCFGLW